MAYTNQGSQNVKFLIIYSQSEGHRSAKASVREYLY